MVLWREFKFKFVSLLAWLFIALISLTVRLKVLGKERIEEIKRKYQNVIYAFWHGRMFLLFHSHRKGKICILSSLSKDGEYLTRVLKKFGYEVARGSSSRGGAKGLIEMGKALKSGYDLAFAVDGPRGPVYRVKPGIIYLAKITGLPIIPVGSSVNRAKILKRTWDRYQLPYPFSRGVLLYGEPVYVPPESEGKTLEEKIGELEDVLNELREEADKLAKRG